MKAFARTHPAVLFFYFAGLLLITMFMSHPVIELLALAGGAVYAGLLTTRKEKKSDLMFYLPLFLIIAVTNPIFAHNGKTPLFFMNGNAVTLEAILYGVVMAITIMAVMLWFKSYNIVMTSDKVLYLFGRVIPQLSLVLSMTLRYVPMIRRQSRRVKRAQQALGLYTSESYFERVRSSLRVMSAVIGWSLERAVDTGRAMKARGYGLKGRTHYSNETFRTSDRIFLIVSLLLFVPLIYLLVRGYGEFYFYPEITPIQTSAPAILTYVIFGLLAFLPALIEWEESIRWNYYRSKI